MTGFWEVNKSAEHIRKINARKGKELCKLKTMLADEQMGMKWAKNKSKLETGKFPAIWGMRSWNSLKGHECLTYSAILMRFEYLNIWPGTTSCAAQWMSFLSFSFSSLSQFFSYRFPCTHTCPGNLAALASLIGCSAQDIPSLFPLKCYP